MSCVGDLEFLEFERRTRKGQIILHILPFLTLSDAIRLSIVNQMAYNNLEKLQRNICIQLSFWDRQRIRKQIFESEPNDRPPFAIPSLFTHIFKFENTTALGLVQSLFTRAGAIKSFQHERSGKELKLYHPYFYRQLPLQLSNNSVLPPPIIQPQCIPLPHDLSLVDFTSILILHHNSLSKFTFNAYTSCPLPWNTSPSRNCPRDIIGQCLTETGTERRAPKAHSSLNDRPYNIRVWCPDCDYASANHDSCWMHAGKVIKDRLLHFLPSEEERLGLLSGWEGADGLGFPSLEFLELSGWALSTFLTLFRVLGCNSFPRLRELVLNGTMIVSPRMTDAKDARPRPKLEKTKNKLKWDRSESERLIKFAEVLSLHFSPFSCNHTNQETEYWLGLFNGSLWKATSTFPSLKKCSIKVGNFDDASRWITPLYENCLSLCPDLEEIELDHCIIQFNPEEDPLVRFFTMVNEPLDDEENVELRFHANETNCERRRRFPSLKLVKIRLVDSPFTLAHVEETISSILGRIVRVQARKILVYAFGHNASAQAALIREWPNIQHQRIHGTIKDSLTLEERVQLNCFAENSPGTANNGMIQISFDGGRDIEINQIGGLNFGNLVSKVALKHYTPSEPLHSKTLYELCFTDRSTESDLLLTCTTDVDGPNKVDSRRPQGSSTAAIRRLDIQLDFPQVWQVTENAAKKAVEDQVNLLKSQLKAHPHFSAVQNIRVGSCTRLTYGGNNWDWWENLITGSTRHLDHTVGVAGQGWVRESKSVINAESLLKYQCEHMERSRDID